MVERPDEGLSRCGRNILKERAGGVGIELGELAAGERRDAETPLWTEVQISMLPVDAVVDQPGICACGTM